MTHYALNIIFIIIISFSSFSCSREPDGIAPTEGIVSYYDFQNDSEDQFNNSDGIENNVKYVLINFRTENSVLSLTGSQSYVKINDPFDYKEKTISLWFNVVEAYDNLSVIFSSDNPLLKFGLTLLNIHKTSSGINLYFNMSNHQDTVQIVTGKWYHAAIASDGSRYFYYLDGSLVTSEILKSYISSSYGENATLIGCDRYMNKRFFRGYIDKLRIYNRKLSDSEIQMLFREKIQ